MQKSEKERVVAELTERLRTSETLIVADYRGLTNAEIDGLRSKLIEHGARFAVVKNTLTRRAAEAAGADARCWRCSRGPARSRSSSPTAIPSRRREGAPRAATSTKILAIRGGVLEGAAMSADEVESLAKLPAGRRAARTARGGDRLAADHDRRARVGAAARPRRADRRPDRAAQGARRYVRGGAATAAEAAPAEEPEAESPPPRRPPKPGRGRGERSAGRRRFRDHRRDHDTETQEEQE